jgi:hypothetical protein
VNRHRSTQRPRSAGLAIAAAFAAACLSACGYHIPHPGLKIGVNSFPVDVLYGATAGTDLPGVLPLKLTAPPAAAGPSPTAAPAMQTAPGPANSPATPTRPSPAAAAPGCPAATSIAVADPAISRVDAAPVAARYPFRSTQSLGATGTHPSTVAFPEVRRVSGISRSGADIFFTVTSSFPGTGVAETTHYEVVTSSAVPADQEDSVPAGTLSGVYITGQSVTSSGDGPATTSTVAWTPRCRCSSCRPTSEPPGR